MPRIMQSVSAVVLLSIAMLAAALCVSCDAEHVDPIDPAELDNEQPDKTPDPEQPPSAGAEIEKLIQQGEHDRALQLADGLVGQNPQSAEAYVLRGKAQLAVADRTEEDEPRQRLVNGAIEDFGEAWKCNRQDYRPRVYLADAYCLMAALDEHNRERYYEMALAEIDAAEKIAGRAIPQMEQMRTGILAQTGRHDESIAALEKLARENPKDSASAYRLSLYAFEHDKIDLALEWLDETLRRDAKFLAALYFRASILIERNRFDEAMADIETIRTAIGDGKGTEQGMVDDLTYLEGILRLNCGRQMMRRADATSVEAREAARNEAAAGMALLEALNREENGSGDFFVLLAQLEVGTNGTSALFRRAFAQVEDNRRDAAIVMPRLHYGLGMALFAEDGRETEAVEEIDKAVKYAEDIRAIMAHPKALTIDKLLARRACAEAVLMRGKMSLEVWHDAAAARRYFLRYRQLRPWSDETERVEEYLYDCDFAEMLDKQLSYEECVEQLKHPYYKIRAAAIKMLSKSDDEKCKRAIAGMLGDDNAIVLRMALDAMKSWRIRENLAGLCALFAHKNEVVAIDAISCAATLKERQTVPALIDALEDERIGIREEAINALMDITTRSMFYHYGDDAEQRAEAVRRWREWWAEENKNDSPGR